MVVEDNTKKYPEDYIEVIPNVIDEDCADGIRVLEHEVLSVHEVQTNDDDGMEISLMDDGETGERYVKVSVDGYEVTIEQCYESWSQYGAPRSVLWKTVPVAEHYNSWLHGGEEPLPMDM